MVTVSFLTLCQALHHSYYFFITCCIFLIFCVMCCIILIHLFITCCIFLIYFLSRAASFLFIFYHVLHLSFIFCRWPSFPSVLWRCGWHCTRDWYEVNIVFSYHTYWHPHIRTHTYTYKYALSSIHAYTLVQGRHVGISNTKPSAVPFSKSGMGISNVLAATRKRCTYTHVSFVSPNFGYVGTKL